jgi:hypothetical protein
MRIRGVRMTLRAGDAVRANRAACPELSAFLCDRFIFCLPAFDVGFAEFIRQGGRGKNAKGKRESWDGRTHHVLRYQTWV